MPAKVVAAAAGVIVAVVAAALIGLFTVGSDSSSDSAGSTAGSASSPAVPSSSNRTSTPAAGSVAVAALRWAQQALPRSTNILIEPSAAAALRALGLHPVTPTAAAGKNIDFVVQTQALLDDAGRYAAVRRALKHSVPVAMFTSSSADVTIKQVTDVSAARLRDANDTRLQADQQLLDNRKVRTDAAIERILQDGGLDPRPAGVVALLTDMGSVQIVRINITAAEQAAGRPARSVDLRADDPAALRRQLTALSGMYRIADVRQTGDGALRATWPVDVTPIDQPN